MKKKDDIEWLSAIAGTAMLMLAGAFIYATVAP